MLMITLFSSLCVIDQVHPERPGALDEGHISEQFVQPVAAAVADRAVLALGKQRVETYQVLNILLDRTATKGWRNHPVTRMWEGYEEALKLYQNFTIQEWINRGYKNNMTLEEINMKNIMLN